MPSADRCDNFAAVPFRKTDMLHCHLTKRQIVIILFTMVVCLIGRNFVANVTFASFNAKPRAQAVSYNQIQNCKDVIKKLNMVFLDDAPLEGAILTPFDTISIPLPDLVAPVFDSRRTYAVEPSRAPPLFS